MSILASLVEAADKEDARLRILIQRNFAKIPETVQNERLYLTPHDYVINADGSVKFHVGVKSVEIMPKLPFKVDDAHALDLSSSGLTSLEGSPAMVPGRYDVSHNTFLKSLEGAPKFTGSFSASSTGITSLKGGPKHVQAHYYIVDTPNLESLKGLPDHITGDLVMTYRDDLPLLPILLVKGLKGVMFPNANGNNNAAQVHKLIAKYIHKDGRMLPTWSTKNDRESALQLQRELIDNGFEKNARF